jgi:hypothetical protein
MKSTLFFLATAVYSCVAFQPTPTKFAPLIHLHSSSTADDETTLPTRRQILELSTAAIGLTLSFASTRELTPQDYGLWGILPVATYKRKATVMETILPNKLWTFDQKLGILNVQVPLRMTVIKLQNGGLFVYNPVAATPEVVEMIRNLEKEHGEVKHIVLGSVAIEHKAYCGVFAQKFKDARVWVQPGQYSFPNNLPMVRRCYEYVLCLLHV